MNQEEYDHCERVFNIVIENEESNKNAIRKNVVGGKDVVLTNGLTRTEILECWGIKNEKEIDEKLKDKIIREIIYPDLYGNDS